MSFRKLFTVQNLMVLMCFLFVLCSNKLLSYILGSVCILCSGIYSFVGLDRRMGIRNLLKKK